MHILDKLSRIVKEINEGWDRVTSALKNYSQLLKTHKMSLALYPAINLGKTELKIRESILDFQPD